MRGNMDDFKPKLIQTLIYFSLFMLICINKWGEFMKENDYIKELNIKFEETINEICDSIEYGDILLYFPYMEKMYLTYDSEVAKGIKLKEQSKLKKIKEVYGENLNVFCDFKEKNFKENNRIDAREFYKMCKRLGLNTNDVKEIYKTSLDFIIEGNDLQSTVNIEVLAVDCNGRIYIVTDILDEIYKKIFIEQ